MRHIVESDLLADKINPYITETTYPETLIENGIGLIFRGLFRMGDDYIEQNLNIDEVIKMLLEYKNNNIEKIGSNGKPN